MQVDWRASRVRHGWESWGWASGISAGEAEDAQGNGLEDESEHQFRQHIAPHRPACCHSQQQPSGPMFCIEKPVSKSPSGLEQLLASPDRTESEWHR